MKENEKKLNYNNNISDEKELLDFLEKQIRGLMIKSESCRHFIETNKPFLARNKVLGVYQKLGYVYNTLEYYEKNNNKTSNE